MGRVRLRGLGITIGELPTGRNNAITDVPGVCVGFSTLVYDEPGADASQAGSEPYSVRTGVTAILPRGHSHADDFPTAGYHSLNGCGEITGVAWVQESGVLMSPVMLTNTAQVGLVRDATSSYGAMHLEHGGYWLPVVAETYDGWLNDLRVRPIQPEHVYQAIDSARDGPVAEGNVGGGTGMICHGYKGGTGTASRLIETRVGRFTVGALVQANYGEKRSLRVDGVPVGRELVERGSQVLGDKDSLDVAGSSIVAVLATDAPLLPNQCRALAQRATIGVARCGGIGDIYSGDLFLAFSTGNHFSRQAARTIALEAMPLDTLGSLYAAAAEAVEEAILNALTQAETMTGAHGHTVEALPLAALVEAMRRYRRL